ncbi:MAG: SDR family NAD(P)-dependent oxidoreductase [Chromatiales bacterium]|nr:SDR family NAD(P)-dependent oxidoreductase [Chromatiales bacterium]
MNKIILKTISTALFVILTCTAALADGFPADGKPTVLITGSNASHGLAFTEEYAKLGWNVIATCRTPDEADRLNALAAENDNVVVEKLDIMSDEDIAALVAKYEGVPIDVLLNNAAINGFRHGISTFGKIDYDWFETQLIVNTLGQLKVSEAFQDNVAMSDQKKIISMTSTGASITTLEVPFNMGYRASKTALNMTMHGYSIYLKKKGVIVGIIGPGTVDTADYMNAADPDSVPPNYKMMMKAGRLVPRTAINDMIGLIDAMTIEDSGVFYQWDGEVLPW